MIFFRKLCEQLEGEKISFNLDKYSAKNNTCLLVLFRKSFETSHEKVVKSL